MRPIKPSNRRRSLWSTVLLGFAALVVGGVGTVAALGFLKVIDLQKLAFWRKTQSIPPDWVAIPICAKPIPAYTAVTREYLLNPRTGDWLMDHQPPEKAKNLVKQGVIIDIEKIKGRVTAREHGAPFYFSESDFLPAGTRPGVAGGTPAGKRAYTLEANKLKGELHDLKEGDHFDLLATVSVDMPGAGRSGGRLGANLLAAPDATLLPKRSVVSPLVQDGVVVTPVHVRNVPISSTQSGSVRTTPAQEIVIAIEPREVAPLAEAIDQKYEIFCVARSGRPSTVAVSSPNQSSGGLLGALVTTVQTDGRASGSDKAKQAADGVRAASPNKIAATGGQQGQSDITPGFNPMGQTRYMEVMVGAQRQYVIFAGRGGSPVVESQEGVSAAAGSEVRPAGTTE